MALIRACLDYDATTGTCVQEAWIDQPGLLPPLPVAEGLQLSGLMLTCAAFAWGWKFLRRFLSPKIG